MSESMKQVVLNAIVRRLTCGTHEGFCPPSCAASLRIRKQFTHNHVMATLKISTVITRTGKKKPTCELLDLKPLTASTPTSAPKP